MGVCCILLSLVLASCKQKKDAAGNSHSENAQTDSRETILSSQKSKENSKAGKSFDDVLNLWISGNKENAVGLFSECNWDYPLSNELLNLTEKAFRQLPDAERLKKQNDCMALTKEIRGIIKNALSKSKEAETNGNIELAKKYLLSISNLGKALSGDDRLDIFRNLGKTVSDLAEKEMNELL